MCDRPTIAAHNINGIVSYVWAKSFVRIVRLISTYVTKVYPCHSK